MSDVQSTVDKLRQMQAVALPRDGIGFNIGHEHPLVTWEEIGALLDKYTRLQDALKQIESIGDEYAEVADFEESYISDMIGAAFSGLYGDGA